MTLIAATSASETEIPSGWLDASTPGWPFVTYLFGLSFLIHAILDLVLALEVRDPFALPFNLPAEHRDLLTFRVSHECADLLGSCSEL